eukprot:2453566-Pyramimonas_sp.AAC.1
MEQAGETRDPPPCLRHADAWTDTKNCLGKFLECPEGPPTPEHFLGWRAQGEIHMGKKINPS